MAAPTNIVRGPGEELKSGVRVLTVGFNNVNKNWQEAVVCSYVGDGKYKIKMGIGKTIDTITVHHKHLRIAERSKTSAELKNNQPGLISSSKSPYSKSTTNIHNSLPPASLTDTKAREDADFMSRFWVGFSSDSETDRDAEHASEIKSVKTPPETVICSPNYFEVSPLKAGQSSIASSDCEKISLGMEFDIKSINSSGSIISNPDLISKIKREESESLIVIKAEGSRRRRLSGEILSDLLKLKDFDCSNISINPSDCSESDQNISKDHWVPDHVEKPLAEQWRNDRFDTLWQSSSILRSLSPCTSIRSVGDSQFLADMSRAERRRIWRSVDMDLSTPVNIPESHRKSTYVKPNVQAKSRSAKKKRKAIFKKKELVELLVSSGSTGHIWVPVQITSVNMSKALPYYDCIAKNPGLYHLPSQQFSSVPQKRLRKLTIDEELVQKNMRVRAGKYKIGDFVEIVNPKYATDSNLSGKKKSSLPKQSGIIRYIGRLNGKKGIWYGLEVMTDNGRHDGTIDGVQYFTVKPGLGVFVAANFVNRKLSRLSIEKLGIFDSKGDFVLNSDIRINNRVELRFGGVGMIKYIGAVPSHRGMWYGIELENPTGKNSGLGMFKCKPKHGIFVRRNRIKTILSQTMTLGVISTRFARNIEALSMNDLSTVSRLQKDIEEAFKIEETLATEIINFLRELGEVSTVLGQDTSDRLHARGGEIQQQEIKKDQWDVLKYFLLQGDARHEFCVQKLTDPWQKEQVQQNSKWPHQQNSQWSKKKKELEMIQDWRLRASHALDMHFCLKAVMNQYEKLTQQLQKKRVTGEAETKNGNHLRALSLTRCISKSQRPKINRDDVRYLRTLVDNATSIGVHKSKLSRPRSVLRMFEAQLELDRICWFYYINPNEDANDVISQTIVDLETAILNAKKSCSEMNNNDYSQQTLAGILDLSEALDLLEFLNVKREVTRATSTGSYEDLLRAQDRAKDLIACKGVSIDLTAVEEKIRFCVLIQAVEVGINNGRLKELAAEMIKLCKKGLWITEYTAAIVKMLEEVSFFHLQQYWRLSELVIPKANSKVAPYFIITRQKCQQEVAIDSVDVLGNRSRLVGKLHIPNKRNSWGRSCRSSLEQENYISGRGQRSASLACEGDSAVRRGRHRRSTHSGMECSSSATSIKLLPNQHLTGDRGPRSSSLPAWFQPKSVPFRGSVVMRGDSSYSKPGQKMNSVQYTPKEQQERYSFPVLVASDEPIFGRNKKRKSYMLKSERFESKPLEIKGNVFNIETGKLRTV